VLCGLPTRTTILACEFSRRVEHAAFLSWLHDRCLDHEPDALLIAGDVFHHANPTSEAVDVFARFTERLLAALPALKIVVVAGNHDSPARFDALRPLVRAGVHLTGSVPRAGLRYDAANMLVRVGEGAILPMPYLRLSDLPPPGDPDETTADRVRAAYAACWAEAQVILDGAPCVVSGHLHVAGGVESESERPILVGGEQAVPTEIFPADAVYVALGHLHCAQSFDGGRIRYSGSPIPLSASERSYKHRIVLLDITAEGALTTTDIFVPRSVAHLRIPAHGAVEPMNALSAIEAIVADLGLPDDLAIEQRPFVEVHLKFAAPQAMAASQLMQDVLAAGLPVRIVKVTPQFERLQIGSRRADQPVPSPVTTPQALFEEAYAAAHSGLAPGDVHRTAFHTAWQGLET
jgi:DNA repair protein SbcD/Mre11